MRFINIKYLLELIPGIAKINPKMIEKKIENKEIKIVTYKPLIKKEILLDPSSRKGLITCQPHV